VIGADGYTDAEGNATNATSQTVHFIVDEETVNFDEKPLETADDLEEMYVLFEVWVHFPYKPPAHCATDVIAATLNLQER